MQSTVAPQVDAALGEGAAEETSEGEAPKPVRTNRASNITSSDPVVKSSEPAGEDANAEAEKPKKAGWWQRRGFF